MDLLPGRAVLGYREVWDAGLERIRSIGMEAYLDLGAETRAQNRLNRDYLDRLVFEMRVLDSGPADTTTTLFGQRVRAPIIAMPLNGSRILEPLGPWNPPYILQMASAMAATQSMMSTGMMGLDDIGRVVEQGAPVVHFVKPYGDDEMVMRHLERAAEAGCVAVGMDVDAFFLEKAWDEDPGPSVLAHKSNDQMRAFCRATRLPFVVKGVLSESDARNAADFGAKGLIVSFHGGEAIDYAMPILQSLPVVRQACPDMTILVDSGFRRGTDVLKALALGANGVGLGAMLIVAFAAGGRDGVVQMMEALYAELSRTMSVTGCRSIDGIDPTVVHMVDL